MKLAAVIPTKNESANIREAISSFDGFRNDVEVVVVDNFSSDGTADIASAAGAKVMEKGPERSAQRNAGWRVSSAEWIIFLDADMTLPRETVEEILETVSSPGAADAYRIPEKRTGRGWRVKARNFERGFYDNTVVDGFRLFRRGVLERTGGYDESLFAAEDWDLDLRVLASGARAGMLRNALCHHEENLPLRRVLAKKAYYSKSFARYKEKWPGHPAVKKQFSAWYRFAGVFVENGKWRRVLAHPVLFSSVVFERFLVGAVYLASPQASPLFAFIRRIWYNLRQKKGINR